MKDNSSTRNTLVEVLTADTLRPSIDLCFERITVKQWNLIILGSPDDTTKNLLTDLILDLITAVTTAVSTTVQKDPQSKKALLSNLGKSIQKSLCTALHIPEKALDAYIICVADMIREEVTEGLNDVSFGFPLKPPTTLSLNAMILVTSTVIKKFACVIKNIFKPQEKQRKTSEEADAKDVKDALGDDDVESSHIKELRKTIDPILDIVPDQNYEEVSSETDKDIQTPSEDNDTFINRKKQKMNPLSLCKEKLIRFFAKYFLKIRSHCLVKLKTHPELRTKLVENV